jgi:hypothetical protein
VARATPVRDKNKICYQFAPSEPAPSKSGTCRCEPGLLSNQRRQQGILLTQSNCRRVRSVCLHQPFISVAALSCEIKQTGSNRRRVLLHRHQSVYITPPSELRRHRRRARRPANGSDINLTITTAGLMTDRSAESRPDQVTTDQSPTNLSGSKVAGSLPFRAPDVNQSGDDHTSKTEVQLLGLLWSFRKCRSRSIKIPLQPSEAPTKTSPSSHS